MLLFRPSRPVGNCSIQSEVPVLVWFLISSMSHRIAPLLASISAWLSCTKSPSSHSRFSGIHLEPAPSEITFNSCVQEFQSTKPAKIVNFPSGGLKASLEYTFTTALAISSGLKVCIRHERHLPRWAVCKNPY